VKFSRREARGKTFFFLSAYDKQKDPGQALQYTRGRVGGTLPMGTATLGASFNSAAGAACRLLYGTRAFFFFTPLSYSYRFDFSPSVV